MTSRHGYIEKRALSEHAKQYSRMSMIFPNAHLVVQPEAVLLPVGRETQEQAPAPKFWGLVSVRLKITAPLPYELRRLFHEAPGRV